MNRRGKAVAARARALVGVYFRPQGRTRETGLDCVGLVAAALKLDEVRADYRLRGGSAEELGQALGQAGLRRVKDAWEGDVLVMRAGAEQLHMGVVTEAGFVHAHAGMPEWPVIEIWRMRGR
jgi:cell wall-associated NlpC family hydrolase